MTDAEIEEAANRLGPFIVDECGVVLTVDMLTVLAMAAAKTIFLTAHTPEDRKIGMRAFTDAATGFLDAAYRGLQS
jgi:hypothetical protein